MQHRESYEMENEALEDRQKDNEDNIDDLNVKPNKTEEESKDRNVRPKNKRKNYILNQSILYMESFIP